jgi:predicted  nucleic acid-binding Zn-ribbon protein
MRNILLIGSLAVLATACVSKSEYDRQLANAAALSAEKDSLLNEVVATSSFIAEVNTELDKVRSGQPVATASGEMENLSPNEARKRLGERVGQLTERVRESEERLAQSRRRVSQLTSNNATQTAQMAAFDSTIKQFQVMIDNQKGEIVALMDQVSVLTSENMALRETNTRIATERESLAAEKQALTVEQNTVYWVAGKKDDLIKRGIVAQRGGMLGIGKTQVLARTLDASEFTAIDRTQMTELALPDPSKTYRMISANDVAGLDSTQRNGRVKGSIKIVAPEVFWRPSRFLVLIEQ